MDSFWISPRKPGPVQGSGGPVLGPPEFRSERGRHCSASRNGRGTGKVVETLLDTHIQGCCTGNFPIRGCDPRSTPRLAMLRKIKSLGTIGLYTVGCQLGPTDTFPITDPEVPRRVRIHPHSVHGPHPSRLSHTPTQPAPAPMVSPSQSGNYEFIFGLNSCWSERKSER